MTSSKLKEVSIRPFLPDRSRYRTGRKPLRDAVRFRMNQEGNRSHKSRAAERQIAVPCGRSRAVGSLRMLPRQDTGFRNHLRGQAVGYLRGVGGCRRLSAR